LVGIFFTIKLKHSIVKMWSAIQSDLMDFVNTVQKDTEVVLAKVLGDDDDDNSNEESFHIREQAIIDLKRSYTTYSDEIDDVLVIEYNKYKKRFNLADCASEVAELLDEEPDIARYYAELIPSILTPLEFWARYFFKLEVLLRGGGIVIGDEDDEDETEIAWESAIDINKDKELNELKTLRKSLIEANKEINQLKKRNQILENTVEQLSSELATRPVQPKNLFSGGKNIKNIKSDDHDDDHDDDDNNDIEDKDDDNNNNNDDDDPEEDRLNLLTVTSNDTNNEIIDQSIDNGPPLVDNIESEADINEDDNKEDDDNTKEKNAVLADLDDDEEDVGWS